MIWVFITTIFGSISEILYKKSISFSDIKPTFFQFFAEVLSIPVIIFLLFSNFNFSLFLDYKILAFFFVNTILFIINTNIGKFLYANEKISTLTPYMTIDNFIIVICGFWFFKDTSLNSFVVCLIAIVVTTIFSIDYKKFSFPKNISTLLLYNFISAFRFIINAYVLIGITTSEFVVLDQIFYLSFSFLAILWLGEIWEYKKITKKLLVTRYFGYAIGFSCYFIDIFLLKEFGIVITTLFTFFGSALSIFLAYIFMKEVPSKKELTLGVIMIFLVGLGYYLK